MAWRVTPFGDNPAIGRFRHLSSALTDMAPHGIRMQHRRPNAFWEQRGPGAGRVLELWEIEDADALLIDRAHMCFVKAMISLNWNVSHSNTHVNVNGDTHVTSVVPKRGAGL